jgi:hypothetical protein
MIFLVEFLVLALFPATAVWAWQSGGSSRLSLLTAAAFVLFVVITVFVSTQAGGNRLAATQGFLQVAPRVLFFFTLILGLPVLVAAVIVRTVGKRVTSPLLLYVTSVGSAFLTFMVGTLLALYAFFG